MQQKPDSRFILASASTYKAALLSRILTNFRTIPANVDESPIPGESAHQLAERLSQSKAVLVSDCHPDAWVIGCDQVANCDGQLLAKPGSYEQAFKQLKLCNGGSVEFITAVTLASKSNHFSETFTDVVTVHFRHLSDEQIERYLNLEQPYDCAGSFKVEKLGISLFNSVKSHDPTSLEGLPLIAVCDLLLKAGYDPLNLH